MKFYEKSNRRMKTKDHFKDRGISKGLTHFFVCFGLIFGSFALSAQTVHNLNGAQGTASLRSADYSIPQEFLKDAKDFRNFVINSALQNPKSVTLGDVVNLQLFEGKSYTATISDAVTDVNSNFTLTLKLHDYPMAFGYITTNKKGKSLFSVSIPELNQKFVSRGNINYQTCFLIEINDNNSINLEDDYKEIPTGIAVNDDHNWGKSQTLRSSRGALSCTRDPNLKGTDPATIHLLIVYTPAAAAWANANEGGIENTLAGAMAQTKAVVDNQRDGDKIVCVHSEQVNYTEFLTDGMNTDLNRLTGTSDGYMDEVHQLRKKHNADIVSLFVINDDTGGRGWMLDDDVTGSYDRAFNVIRVQQASWTTTLIHEIGHNLGMLHNTENNSISPPLYPYAYGWHWNGNDGTEYGSVMSYIGVGAPYFSNPNETYKGKSTGTSTANNTQVFRNTKHIVAFYSEKLNNLPDVPTNIVVSNPTNTGATISWKAVANVSNYVVGVYDSGSSGAYYNFSTGSATTITLDYVNIFSPCTTYYFFIQAVNECGDTVSSQTLTFTTKCPNATTFTTLAATNATQAWVQNGILHVSGLTVGKRWKIYNVTGTLVYQNIADSDEANTSLTARGIYFVQSDNGTVKVVY